MTTALKTGLFAAGAILAYNAFAKGSAAKALNFYPKKINSISFDGLAPVITFTMGVQNVSNQQMTFFSIAGDLYADDFLIGNISSFLPVTIRANAETEFKFSCRLALIGIVQKIITAFQGGGFQQEIKFKATANINRYTVPVVIKYKIGA